MASAANEPLLQADAPPQTSMASRALRGCGCLIIVALVVAGIAQATIFYAVTLGCGPRAIGDNYNFPGGATSPFGGPAYNLLPQTMLLSERAPNLYGWPLDVIPANDASTAAGAQTGTWWRNRGPLFYTYTYEDIANSKLTVYMRANFLRAPIMSYKIARCDGKGPVVTFTETGHFIDNKIRHFFRMNQAQTYSVYVDDKRELEVKQISSGVASLTVTNVTTGEEVSSAILNGRHFHGSMDQWLLNNQGADSLPYWITSAIALPFAFEEAETKQKDDSKEETHLKAPSAPAPAAEFLTKADEGLSVEKEQRLVEKTMEQEGRDQANEDKAAEVELKKQA